MSDLTDLITRNERKRKACRAEARAAWVNIMVALDDVAKSDEDLRAIDIDKAAAQLQTLKIKREEMRELLETRQSLLARMD